MKLLASTAATAVALCLLTAPAFATPVAGFVTFAPTFAQRPAAPLIPICHDVEEYDEGGGEEEEEESEESAETGFGFGQADDSIPIPVDCEGSDTYGKSGPAYTDIVVASIERGTQHCGQYKDVWRIDCISDELERMAQKMPKTGEYRRAKSEILAASAKLRALAQQNADPKQPPVRRAAQVGNTRRTTTRPITAVAPDRVVATNRAADAVISELATTLLRSAGNSPTTSRELMRVSQAVDSTKVLLRST